MLNYKDLDPCVLALFLGYKTDENGKNYATSILLNPRPGQSAFQQQFSLKPGYGLPGIHVCSIDDKLKNVAIGAHISLYGAPFAFEQVKIPLIKRLPGGEFAYRVATVTELDDFYTTVRFAANDRMVPGKSRMRCIKLHNANNVSFGCGDTVLLKNFAFGKWAIIRNITQEKNL